LTTLFKFWRISCLFHVKFSKQNLTCEIKGLSRNCKRQVALSGDIKGRSRVAFVFGKAFQMTSQNASLREREQVSLRRSVGVTATGSRCNYFKATERAIERGTSHRIMLLQWSWGFANLQSFPRGHTSSLLGPSFLPSFLPSTCCLR